MNRSSTHFLSIFLVIAMVISLVTMSVSAQTEEPMDSGLFEGKQADGLQPFALDLREDKTFRLYGGESSLFLYGRYEQEDQELILYMSKGDDVLLALEATDEESYRVKRVESEAVGDNDALAGVTFSRLVSEATLSDKYQLAKSFLRKLVLNQDMTFELWRPPIFSFLPTGTYAVDGHELVISDRTGWEMMRLLVLSDGIVVPEISQHAASHFMITTGDVFVPLLDEPEISGAFESGDVRLELAAGSDEEATSRFKWTLDGKDLDYRGSHFAYNDRLFLVDYELMQGGFDYSEAIIFEFQLVEDRLVLLKHPFDDYREHWRDLVLTKTDDD